VTAGQLDCHKLHNAAGSVLVIHDWVVAQQDECVTSIPETPPTSRLTSIIQDCDHEVHMGYGSAPPSPSFHPSDKFTYMPYTLGMRKSQTVGRPRSPRSAKMSN